jgi:hypothetical protein
VIIVYRAVKFTSHFKRGRSSVCDEKRSGRLSSSRTENNIRTTERMVRENRCVTFDDIAEASMYLGQ